MRANHDLKIIHKSQRNMTQRGSTPSSYAGAAAFGKPNRPQTPVTGIITNEYGAHGEAMLQERYAQWKAQVSFRTSFETAQD